MYGNIFHNFCNFFLSLNFFQNNKVKTSKEAFSVEKQRLKLDFKELNKGKKGKSSLATSGH